MGRIIFSIITALRLKLNKKAIDIHILCYVTAGHKPGPVFMKNLSAKSCS